MHRLKRTAAAVLLFCLLLSAGTTYAGMHVEALAKVESDHLEAQGFAVPDHVLVVVDMRLLLGLTIYSQEPLQYVVLLRPWYIREGLAEAVIAHEYGHVLLRQADVPGDPEVMADRAAACFGTPGAQDWARRVWRADPSAEECQTLRAQLVSKGAVIMAQEWEAPVGRLEGRVNAVEKAFDTHIIGEQKLWTDNRETHRDLYHKLERPSWAVTVIMAALSSVSVGLVVFVATH